MKKTTKKWWIPVFTVFFLALLFALPKGVKAEGPDAELQGEYRFMPWFSYYTYNGDRIHFSKADYETPFIIQYGTKKITLNPGSDSFNDYYPLDEEWIKGKTIQLLSVPAPQGYETVFSDQPILQFGKGSYTEKEQKLIQCRISLKKKGEKADLSNTYVSVYFEGGTRTFGYTGKPVSPKVEVYLNGQIPLVKGRDYTVTYTNNTNIGTAKVSINGIGTYTGKCETWFQIMPGVTNPTPTPKPSPTPTPKPSPTPIPKPTPTPIPSGLGKVQSLSAEAYNEKSIKITWEPVSGAEGYKIYRKTSVAENWSLISIIKNPQANSYVSKNLTTGQTYYYTVQVFRGNESNVSATAYVQAVPAPVKPTPTPSPTPTPTSSPTPTPTPKPITPGKVQLLGVVSNGYNSVKITWKAVSGAEGYKIYRKTSASGTWKLLSTVKDAKASSYVNKKLTTGKKYYYRIKAYNGNKIGSASVTKSAVPTVARPLALMGTRMQKGIELVWHKSSGASGYVIYRKKRGESYKKIKTITNGSTELYMDTTAARNITYTYTIKAYRKVNGIALYSDYMKSGYTVNASEEPIDIPVSGAIYELECAADDNYVLDVYNLDKADGTNVQICSKNGGSNQRFRIVSLNNGYYAIYSMCSGKVVDVENGGKKNGTNILQWSWNGQTNQQWKFIWKDGYYYIQSRCNGLYMEARNGVMKDETNVQCYQYKGTQGQRFKLKRK